MSQQSKTQRQMQISELPREQRLKVRPVLMQGLVESGALIFERTLIGGHKLYTVLPGESGEVRDEHCAAVWSEIAAALREAANTAEEVGLRTAVVTPAHLNVKGGSA